MHQLAYSTPVHVEMEDYTGYSSTTAVTPPTLWDEVSALHLQ